MVCIKYVHDIHAWPAELQWKCLCILCMYFPLQIKAFLPLSATTLYSFSWKQKFFAGALHTKGISLSGGHVAFIIKCNKNKICIRQVQRVFNIIKLVVSKRGNI